MHIEIPLIAVIGSLFGALEALLDLHALLYALIVFVVIPVVSFAASEACAALIGHYALRICMRKAGEEKAALEVANKDLAEQNCRLMAVNTLLVADCGRLRRANKRLLRRALKAELDLAGPRARQQIQYSAADRRAGLTADPAA